MVVIVLRKQYQGVACTLTRCIRLDLVRLLPRVDIATRAIAVAVAYITFSKQSEAALAIEQLNGAVLNQGRGPKLKVLLAEAPPAR